MVSDNGAVSVLGLSDGQEASVCYKGTNGDWSDEDARVVCRHMQYLDGKAVLLMEEEAGGELAGAGLVVSDFDCNGGMIGFYE